MKSLILLMAACVIWGIVQMPIPALAGPAYVRDYFDHADEPHADEELNLIDEMHTRRAIQLIRESRYNDALRDIRFTLNHWPNHPQALMILVGVSQLLESPGIPKAYFEKALKLYPQHALTHAQFGKFLADLGEVNDGVERLKYAVKIEPALIPAYVWLSEIYAAKGDKVSATEALDEAKRFGYHPKASGDERVKGK